MIVLYTTRWAVAEPGPLTASGYVEIVATTQTKAQANALRTKGQVLLRRDAKSPDWRKA